MEKPISESNQLRDLIYKRTGLKHQELVCPREKSEMTPCVARDGDLAAIIEDYKEHCVGCMANVQELLRSEELKHTK